MYYLWYVEYEDNASLLTFIILELYFLKQRSCTIILCLELLTNFYHSFDEFHINDTLGIITQQYIMNVLGTLVCVRITLNTGYYEHMVASIQ